MLHFFWSFVAFIITFGVLITVHEFGHFWVARRCGVTVERFSIGFGYALWRRFDKRGTEYIIATIPLGGYIKMLDERSDTIALDRRYELFNQKTVWQRAMIVTAGPVFNFLFAIFTYWLVFLIGVPSYRPTISDIASYPIATQAKIFPGINLKSVSDIETPDWDSVRLQLIDKIDDGETNIDIASFWKAQNERKMLNFHGWQFESNKQDVIIALSTTPLDPRIKPLIAKVQQWSAEMKSGLQAGNRIAKVDDQPVVTQKLFVTQIRDNTNRPLQVGIELYSNDLDIALQSDIKSIGKGEIEGFAVIVPKIIPLSVKYKTFRRYDPLQALVKAIEKTWQLMRLTISILSKLVTGDIRLNNLSGPIYIAHSAGISAEYGLIYYLMFLAIISVNLGIINLFPLPLLDGGHLLFLAIEKLKGEPVSEQVKNFSYRISSILLVLLIGLAIFNDFSRL